MTVWQLPNNCIKTRKMTDRWLPKLLDDCQTTAQQLPNKSGMDTLGFKYMIMNFGSNWVRNTYHLRHDILCYRSLSNRKVVIWVTVKCDSVLLWQVKVWSVAHHARAGWMLSARSRWFNSWRASEARDPPSLSQCTLKGKKFLSYKWLYLNLLLDS